jgi:hypothetical protein
MSKKWFVVKALATLIIIGLLILGGFTIHRIGWSQGYQMGQLVAGGEKGAVAPYGFGYPGLFLTVGLLLLLLVVIGKFLRLLIWGPWMMVGGPRYAHWARHWHRPHGHMPPWCWDWERPFEEKAEPDAETGNAEA